MDTRRGPIFLILALAMGIAAAWFTQRTMSKPSPPHEMVAGEHSRQPTPVKQKSPSAPQSIACTHDSPSEAHSS